MIRRSGTIVRRIALGTLFAIVGVVAYAGPALADTIVPTLVREVQTSQWNPSSPDPMGIAYQASSGRLLVVDSEVEEMTIWNGVNFWEVSKTGSVQRTSTTYGGTQNFSSEPTDVAVRPSDGHLFFSDDVAHKIHEVALGNDGLFGTSDDSVTSRALSLWGSSIDAEGLAYGGGDLFIADGSNQRIIRVGPGSNGKFDGAPPSSDDVVSTFSTSSLGQSDPEAVEYNGDAGTLFVGSRKVNFISEVTLGGSLLHTYSLSSFADFKSSSGIAYAPTSNNSSGRSLYVVDRRTDNDTNPSENDGLLFEFAIGSGPPPANSPPVVTSPGNRTNNEGASVSLQVVATDADNDPLTYSASTLPAGLSINTSTGLISGTVSSTAASGSPYSSSVSASDGQASDTKNFTWTVNDTTSPVVVNPGTQTNNEGDTVSLQIVATDADNDPLTYSASGLPAGLSINTATGRITGTVGSNAANNSPYSPSVSAGDGSTSDTENFTWTIGTSPPPNSPPVVTNPGNQSDAEGASVSLQVVATDADAGQTLTYSASNLPGGLSINTATGLVSGTISSTAATGSPYSSSVSANDGIASDTKNFTWTVSDPTQPSVTSPGTQSSNEGAPVNLAISASDADNDALTYSASGLPTGLSINTSTGVISGTISAGAASGSPFASSVRAGDGSSSDTKNFTWNVNGPPVVTNPGTQNNAEDATVNLQVVASDPNAGDTLTYSAANLPPGLSINPSSGLISGTVAAGAGSGSPYSAQVSASDGSLSDTEAFTWNINAAPAAPTNLTIRSRTDGLLLDWNNNGETDLAGYDVYRSATSGSGFTKVNTSLLTSSEYLDTGAPAGAQSYYQVKAVDSQGAASPAATANAHRGPIVFVGSASVQGGSKTVKINKPAGTQAGDLLLAVIAVRAAPAITTVPAGWTLVTEQITGSNVMRQLVYQHTAGSSEPSSYSWVIATKQGFVGQILTYRGAVVAASDGSANPSGTSITAPGVTAPSAESVAVGFFGTAAFASISQPSAMVERLENGRSAGPSGSRVTIESADAVVPAGPLPSVSATASVSAFNVGQLIVLSPAP